MKKLSQLDLTSLGRRGITSRLSAIENQVHRLITGSGGAGDASTAVKLRPNLFVNSSFELFDRNSTTPQDWQMYLTPIVSVGAAGADGVNTVKLGYLDTVSQLAAGGVVVPQSSVVLSVSARTSDTSQKIALSVTHTPGVAQAPVMRLDGNGTTIQTDDLPSDGAWYRFYRSFILTGGATALGSIGQAGAGGIIEVDAAKFEKEDGVSSWLEPSAYVSDDWGAASHIRNLSADNITVGTLSVGGSNSANPRISVKDGSDTEIVTIGAPTGGFRGINVKNGAGIKVQDNGSVEVLGTGKLQVVGGVIRAGTDNAQRVDILQTGLFSYNTSGVLQGSISAVDGKWTVTADALNITGQLSLASLAVSGAATVGQDFTVGANILRVASATSNIGVNRTPDAQFDLDVNGNFRAGGYIVGKHALQISGARLISHFDGPQPVETDFTGAAEGHMGQVPTISGGVVYRPGKFGKGVQVAEAVTNLLPSPSFESGVTNWSVNQGSWSIVSGALYGLNAGRLTYAGSGDCYGYQSVPVTTAAGGRTFTVSFYVRVVGAASGSALGTVSLRGDAEDISYALTGVTDEWVRHSFTGTYSAGVTATTLTLHLRSSGSTSHHLEYDAIQVEEKSYATPYCDGSLGAGHTWAGTAHSSASSRTLANLAYANAGGLKANKGTVMFWAVAGAGSSNNYREYVRSDCTGGTIDLRVDPSGALQGAWGGALLSAASAGLVAGTQYHLAMTYDGVILRLYRDGTEVANAAHTSAITAAAAPLFVGQSSGASLLNGVLDDLVLLDRAASASEIRAVYESGAPVFAETSTWAWRTPNNLAWADSEGLWAINKSGSAAFGACGVDGKSWANLGFNIDAGDVVLGNSTNYLMWDASIPDLKLVAGSGVIKLNATGLSVTPSASPENLRAYKFAEPDNTVIGGLYGYSDANTVTVQQRATGNNKTVNVSNYVAASSTYAANWSTTLFSGINASTPISAYVDSDTTPVSRTTIGGAEIVLNGAAIANSTLTTTGVLTANGDIRANAKQYFGSTSYFYSDDGIRTAHQGNAVFWNDVYVGAAGGWLGTLLNQAVRTDSSPTHQEVYANGWFRSNTSGAGWYHVVHGGGWYMSDNTWIRSYNGKQVVVVTSTGTQLRLSGSPSGNSALELESAANAANMITLSHDGTNTNFYSAQAAVNLISMYSGAGFGRVGIRKDTPAYTLEVGFDSCAKPGTSSWTVASDERAKMDVRDFTAGLDDLKKLPQPVYFRYNGKLGTPDPTEDEAGVREYVGWKAQEVECVRPDWVRKHAHQHRLRDDKGKLVRTDAGEVVYEGRSTETLALDTDEHRYLLHNAVLELAARVEALEAEVIALRGKGGPQ